jgi:hypothetical protein
MGLEDRSVAVRSALGGITLLKLSSVLLGQTKPALDGRYGKLPLSFEENRGQTDALLALRSGKQNAVTGDVLRMRFARRVGRAIISGMEQLPGKALHVPDARNVNYKDVYPGLDPIYYGYGNPRQTECDFVPAPLAYPTQVKLPLFGSSGCCEIADADSGNGAAIARDGDACVAGVTYSSDFPITEGRAYPCKRPPNPLIDLPGTKAGKHS